MFPTEKAAVSWFERLRWPEAEPGENSTERACPKCGSFGTYAVKAGKPMPYRCRDCKGYFSAKTGTALEASNVPMRKWAFATYLWVTSLKGVSAMKLHRDLKVSYPTAWFMAHRLREAFAYQNSLFTGPVEVDETYMGGRRRNMAKSKRAKLEGRGTIGKAAVVGAKDRPTNQVSAKVVPDTTANTLKSFILENIHPETIIFTDDATVYENLPNHESVKHSAAEYVRGPVHTNGIESFWSMLKRAHMGTFHKLSVKHLQKYVNEFVGRHNIRTLDTLDQMAFVALALVGRRLKWKELIS